LIFGMSVQMMQKHLQFAGDIEDDTSLIFRNRSADNHIGYRQTFIVKLDV
jgi:hypothetical protein